MRAIRDAVAWAQACIRRWCDRWRSRTDPRAVRAAELAGRLRRRRPWCDTCATHVERCIVVHETGDIAVRVIATCHGRTRVRDIPAVEAEAMNFVELADWLTLPVFAPTTEAA